MSRMVRTQEHEGAAHANARGVALLLLVVLLAALVSIPFVRHAHPSGTYAWKARSVGFEIRTNRGTARLRMDGTPVDVRVRSTRTTMEYDVFVPPQLDLDSVVIAAEGVTHLTMSPAGSLRMHTADGVITQLAPRAWERIPGGGRHRVSASFRIIDRTHYGFAVASHNPARALVIDPVFDFGSLKHP